MQENDGANHVAISEQDNYLRSVEIPQKNGKVNAILLMFGRS